MNQSSWGKPVCFIQYVNCGCLDAKTIFYHNNYGDAIIYSSWMLLYVIISKPDSQWKLVVYFCFNFL